MSWQRYDGTRLTLTLHIQPGAKTTEIIGVHGDALKIKVAALPVEGAANAALIAYLAQRFAVPQRQVEIKAGATARRKIVTILNPVNPVESLFP